LSEINSTKLDLAVGLNQITNATIYNYVNGNWYKNQYDDNFNSENSNTRFIYQSGSLYTPISGLVFAKIHSTSGTKDIIVSRGDSLFVFENSSNSITTHHVQRFLFVASIIQTSGRFTTDAVEDVGVLRNDSIFIFKGKGTVSALDSVPAFKKGGASGSNVKIVLAQISNWLEPYATINGTTSDRDEIIMRQGNTIVIFKNDNNNGISTSTTFSNLTSITEFAIGDVNNDGFNDLLTCSITQGIKIFLNNGTTIDTSADYTNSGEQQTQSISYADFDKDGWNDLIVNTFDSLKIFLNNHSGSMFSQTRTYSIPVSDGTLIELWTPKMSVVDLHNKGGLTVLQSGFPAFNFEAPPYLTEVMYRYNPLTIDANPAPAYLFKGTALDDTIYYPKLKLFNRRDRDFLKYKIYKKNWVTYYYYLFDSTTASEYIDTTEDLISSQSEPSPESFNTFYYVRAEDNSYKVSITSDIIGYYTFVCPTCFGEIEPRIPIISNENNELPKAYSLSNYPNPFNPSTKIYYTIPKEGNVKITVYNSIGQKVNEIVNEFKNAGAYVVDFNGSNMSSGIYYYTLESNGFVLTKRMLLIK